MLRIPPQIVRFLAVSALDLLIPDVISIPFKLCENFYRHFIATDVKQQLELLQEARNLSAEQIEEVTDALATEWRSLLVGGTLTDAQRALLRQLVLSLHQVSRAPVPDPAEALLESLNRSVIAPGSDRLAAATLLPEQQAVGRSLLRMALAGKAEGRPCRPMPAGVPRVPGYALLRVLGQGGFSIVYLACHEATGQPRAVKVGPLTDQVRFQREVRLLGNLTGDHIVRYHEHGELPGQFWIAMDYVGEYTLGDLIRGRPTTEPALVLAEQVLRGLESLHQAGVVHRDLKPENAIVDAGFRLRLIDFGLAKALPSGPAPGSAAPTLGLVGTPRYMSPEQVSANAEPTRAADLWAFGCVLYELFTGRPLFEAANLMALGHEILTKPVLLDAPEIPPESRGLLEWCLAREVAERCPDAGQALAEFSRTAGLLRQRLRQERQHRAWGGLLEKGLLEQFALRYTGRSRAEALGWFVALARQEGVKDIDERRLESVLRPILVSQQRVADAEEALARAREKLLEDVDQVARAEVAKQTVTGHELTPASRQPLRDTVEVVLEELQRWEDRQLSAPESGGEVIGVGEELSLAPVTDGKGTLEEKNGPWKRLTSGPSWGVNQKPSPDWVIRLGGVTAVAFGVTALGWLFVELPGGTAETLAYACSLGVAAVAFFTLLRPALKTLWRSYGNPPRKHLSDEG
jgi:hypothetical protein